MSELQQVDTDTFGMPYVWADAVSTKASELWPSLNRRGATTISRYLASSEPAPSTLPVSSFAEPTPVRSGWLRFSPIENGSVGTDFVIHRGDVVFVKGDLTDDGEVEKLTDDSQVARLTAVDTIQFGQPMVWMIKESICISKAFAIFERRGARAVWRWEMDSEQDGWTAFAKTANGQRVPGSKDFEISSGDVVFFAPDIGKGVN